MTQTEIIKAEPLPPTYSAQAAELVALTEAFKLMKEVVTIYTDSQHVFSTVHVFAQYWDNRGHIKREAGNAQSIAAGIVGCSTAAKGSGNLQVCGSYEGHR